MGLGWLMRARPIVAIACAAVLTLSASAGADQVSPDAVAPAETPAPTTTPAPEATPATTPVAAPAPAPAVAPVPTATPAAQATPAPVVVATPAVQATPAPVVVAASAAAQPTPAPVPTATPSPEPPPTPAPGDCTVELPDGSTGCAEDCASSFEAGDGTIVCEVAVAVCSILGTYGDDVLTGSPFDDILCGLGGDDRVEGGDGDDVLVGGDGDDVLVGGPGDDCMVGGPGTDQVDSADEYDDPVGPPGPDGRCREIRQQHRPLFTSGNLPRPGTPPATDSSAGLGAAGGTSAQTSGSDLRLSISDGRLAVRDDKVRVPVTCSAVTPGELVLLVGSKRIARKRFTCTPPGERVRVRLNEAGRELVADDDRIEARVIVLAADRTVSEQVLLVS